MECAGSLTWGVCWLCCRVQYCVLSAMLHRHSPSRRCNAEHGDLHRPVIVFTLCQGVAVRHAFFAYSARSVRIYRRRSPTQNVVLCLAHKSNSVRFCFVDRPAKRLDDALPVMRGERHKHRQAELMCSCMRSSFGRLKAQRQLLTYLHCCVPGKVEATRE